MKEVTPKKRLGQHFLKDISIAERITDCLSGLRSPHVAEIGPGMGVLTTILIKNTNIDFKVIEIDDESVSYLKANFKLQPSQIIHADVLRLNWKTIFGGEPYNLIGNLPYNISSQIFFKIYENRQLVQQAVFMIQKEVAERIAAGPGGKVSGILSIFIQAFYDVTYRFTVPPTVFNPPPKVQSGVLTLVRNQRETLPCDESLFFRLVKQGFNNRRKTLRNALKPLGLAASIQIHPFLDKRAEQLSVDDFITLATLIGESKPSELGKSISEDAFIDDESVE